MGWRVGGTHALGAWAPLSAPQMVGANVRNRCGRVFVIRVGVSLEQWLHAHPWESDSCEGGSP